MIAAVWWYYLRERAAVEAATVRELSAISRMETAQIEHWRAENVAAGLPPEGAGEKAPAEQQPGGGRRDFRKPHLDTPEEVKEEKFEPVELAGPEPKGLVENLNAGWTVLWYDANALEPTQVDLIRKSAAVLHKDPRYNNFVASAWDGAYGALPNGTPIALGYHTGHWEVGLLMEEAARVINVPARTLYRWL